MLTINNLKPAVGSKHCPKKVGRGNASGHGTYSCRGGKGQTARSGGGRGLKLRGFKALMQSTPKLGGFRSLNLKPATIALSVLEKKYQAGETVNLESLKKLKIVGKNVESAKIVNGGELTKKLTIEGIKATKSVAEKIKSLGGEIK
jgi:large subunit ribosomal protein L15